jgi:hypothetical protein
MMAHVDPAQRTEIISFLVNTIKEPLSEANPAAISAMQAIGFAKTDTEAQRRSIIAALEEVAPDEDRLPPLRQLAARALMEFTRGNPTEIRSTVSRYVNCIKQSPDCKKVSGSSAALILGNLELTSNDADEVASTLLSQLEASAFRNDDRIGPYLSLLGKVAIKLNFASKGAIVQKLLEQISSKRSSLEPNLVLSALSILPALYSDEIASQAAVRVELLRRIDEENDPQARVVAIAAISRLATSDVAFQTERFAKLRRILSEEPKARTVLDAFETAAQAEAAKGLSALDSLTANQAEEIAKLLVQKFVAMASEAPESVASRDALNRIAIRYPDIQSKLTDELISSVPDHGSTSEQFRSISVIAAIVKSVNDSTFSRLLSIFSDLGESGKDRSGYARRALARILVNLASDNKLRKEIVANALVKLLRGGSTKQAFELSETAIEALTEVGLPPTADRDAILEMLIGYLRPGRLAESADGQISRAIATFGPIGARRIAQLYLLMNLDAPTDERTAFWRARAIAYAASLDEEQDDWFLIHALGRTRSVPWDGILQYPSERLVQLDKYWPGNDTPGAKGLQSELAARLLELIRRNCASKPESTGGEISAILVELKELVSEEVRSTLRWLTNFVSADKVGRCWSFSDRQRLRSFERKFTSGGHTNETELLSAAISKDERPPMLGLTIVSYVAWALPSVVLLLLFPHAPAIRRLYLFNDTVRNVLSLGWISIIIQASPVLRRRLLIPFRSDLLAYAGLGNFDPPHWYSDSKLVDTTGQSVSLRKFAVSAEGVCVIIGESGLGKTTLLQSIASQDTKPIAFLAAEDCSTGVIEAIIERTQNLAGSAFFNFLIQSGDLRVFIDGLNHVAPETRATIFKFANNSAGNILITTQPLESINMKETPLGRARLFELQPLEDAEVKKFLLTRPARDAKDSSITGAQYDVLVGRLLDNELGDKVPDERKVAVREICSNPMDLTYASELISMGELPIAEDMIGQAFKLARGEYLTYAKMDFPTSGFAKKAVELRKLDRNWFYEDEFRKEQEILSKYRILVTRTSYDKQGKEALVRMFRHSKVWDYFIFFAFQEDRSLRQKHLADFRFRGAYLLFAYAADILQARTLGDEIVRRAAMTGDHSLSDEYLRRLMARENADRSR